MVRVEISLFYQNSYCKVKNGVVRMKKILCLALAGCLCLSITACSKSETKSVFAKADFEKMFVSVAVSETNEQTNDSGGIEHLAYTSPIQNDFLFIESRLVDYVGEDAFKEWTHAESANGTYERAVNVPGYIKHFNITKEQLVEACNVVPDLPLYTPEQIDALYNPDIESVLRYVKNTGAVYSNEKLYSIEWLDCNTAEQFYEEKIDIDELKAEAENIHAIIEAFGKRSCTAVSSFENKIAEYEKLLNS